MTVQSESNQPGRSGRFRATEAPVARPARPDDARAIAAVNVAAWRDAYRCLVPAPYLDALDESALEERWLERLAGAAESDTFVVAEIGGQVVAYAMGGRYRTQQDAPAEEDTRGWGELLAIYAHPQFQGRGAGRAVHDSVITALQGSGFTTAALWVLCDNLGAIGWYGSRGWRPDGATSTWHGSGVPLPEIRLVRALTLPGPV